ncbi:SRPBCC domain-containing protein [Pseudomonas sp. ODNR1LW]|nr:SRPBCC domain-containing protein [Pseudomonas sp. ODNR1LW]
MDDAKIDKRAGVKATSDRIWELVSDLSRWGEWNPYETRLEGVIAFGGQLGLTEGFPGQSERRATARVADWRPYVRLVWTENRGFLFRTLRYIDIEELEKGSCIVSSGHKFAGLRGELFHDKHRAGLRDAHQDIVDRLKAAAEA